MYRQEKHHIPSFKVNMGGMFLDQALPSATVEHVDPFLLLHHAKTHVPAGGHPRDFGVGPHPHRGFSPVTFVIKGAVLHQDSRGHYSEVETGGVQWMHSGMGLIHSERPTQSFLNNGGEYEIIQLWINSPASSKFKEPSYQALSKEQIPHVSLNKGGQLKVIAGAFEGQEGPITTETPMEVLWLDALKDESLVVNSPQSNHCMIYVIEGGVEVNKNKRIFSKELLVFDQSADQISLEFTANTQLLYLSANPINEKVVSHGPYVMNSESEIMEAMRDYQMGKMGMLVEEFK